MLQLPQYHVIEKEDEVVFYIPYEAELVNLYTKDFFGLHSQDAEIAVIAFHNNDEIVMAGGGADEIRMPYRIFYNRAKYIEDQLKKRFNEVPDKERSYNLFSALIDNTKQLFQREKKESDVDVAEVEPSPVESSSAESSSAESSSAESSSAESSSAESSNNHNTLWDTTPLESVSSEPTPEESTPMASTHVEIPPTELTRVEATPAESTPEEPTPTIPTELTQIEPTPMELTPEEITLAQATPIETTEVVTKSSPTSTGYIFQIIIQKKPPVQTKPKLKIPVDVLLEKELDYFKEYVPDRPIRYKYALHGIYMLA